MPASPATARALPPSAIISAASASSRSLRLAVMTTAAPARARAAAVAYPMPELAPVTMAVFPERGLFMIVLLFLLQGRVMTRPIGRRLRRPYTILHFL